MSDQQRQADFAERLRRIEQKRGEGEPETIQQSKPEADYDYGVPQNEDHRIRNGIIWVSFVALLGAGGYFGVQALPEDLKEALADLSSDDDDAPVTTGGMVSIGTGEPAISETDTMTDQGPIFASPSVAHAGTEPLSLADVTGSADLTNGDSAIGQLVPFARNAQCDLRDPLPSEKIMNVRIENALLTAPIQAFSNEQLAQQLLNNVEQVTQEEKSYDFNKQFSGQKTSIDVFISDTSAPLYLVLQNMGSGIIWNLHAAPDVTIAHVAIVSSGHSGLVDPPNNATFEALLVRDFVTPYRFGGDDEVRPCMIRPWRNPQPDWIGSIKAAQGGNLLFENQMHSYASGHAAFNAWYTETLGVDASTNLVTARDAAHVLIGPAPAEPIPYNTMAGQDVHFMDTDNILTGDTATRQRLNAGLHSDVLLAAVGDDVSALNPAPMERPTQ